MAGARAAKHAHSRLIPRSPPWAAVPLVRGKETEAVKRSACVWTEKVPPQASREGAGDGQAQAAAPVGAALVPPDEPLGEIHPVGQLLP